MRHRIAEDAEHLRVRIDLVVVVNLLEVMERRQTRRDAAVLIESGVGERGAVLAAEQA